MGARRGRVAGVSVSAVERLAASRQRLAQALQAPAAAPLAAQLEALMSPSIQRHPWRWILGALASGGLLAATWKRLPSATQSAVLRVAQALGQEALLAWWLDTLAHPTESPPPANDTKAAGTAPDSHADGAPKPP